MIRNKTVFCLLVAASVLAGCVSTEIPETSQVAPLEKTIFSNSPDDFKSRVSGEFPRLENPFNVDYLQANISREYPRLILTQAIETRLKEELKSDPVVKNVYAAIKLNADRIYKEDLLKRQKVGRRLLGVSREMLYRMNVLGMVYKMEGDKRALDRINDELIAVSNFSDWNPSHFLDVGEMSLAVSLALDWTHGHLPDSTVRLAKQALIEKGLLPSWENPNGRGGRTYAENNWNQVCNGGLVAAAISIAGEDPELAAKTIYRALDGLPVALQHYGPDGTHHEGSTYWNYATVYTAAISSMFDSAFGTDFGIWEYPGIAQSGVYRLVMTAPSGWYYNYGDCGNKRSENGDLTLAWFAANSGNATYIERDRFLRPADDMGKLDRLAGAGLVWLSLFEQKYASGIPDFWYARSVNPVAIFRGGDHDPKGFYFGAKGGCGAVNHGNMDGGSFIFELNGVRWAIDMGKQDYNTIEQTGFNLWGKTQDSDRWKLLSKNNFGHSTITVNNQLHVVNGSVPLLACVDGDSPTAVFDMSPTLGDLVTSAKRIFTKDSSTSITIRDQIIPSDKTNLITWQMMTLADVETSNGHAVLKQDGKQLLLECISHPDARIEIVPLYPPPMKLDSHIEGLKRLEIRFSDDTDPDQPLKIIVRLSDDL